MARGREPYAGPGNAAYATTYAYSLLSSGKVREAEKVMDFLKPEQLRNPAISAYYGLCLAGATDPEHDAGLGAVGGKLLAGFYLGNLRPG